jgi:hypothetical protein
MSEFKLNHLDSSELARELISLYPHLKDHIEHLQRMHMGESLRTKLIELRRELVQGPIAHLLVGQELATELSNESISLY